MKRILKKPLVVAMMLGFALVSTSVDASDGKSLKIENLDNKENYYPHRAPARYSIKAVGHLDSTKGIFSISLSSPMVQLVFLQLLHSKWPTSSMNMMMTTTEEALR